jgi:hypothetical protein
MRSNNIKSEIIDFDQLILITALFNSNQISNPTISFQ